MNFSISPRSLLKFFLVSVSFLSLAQLCIIAAQHVPGHGRYDEFMKIFNFNNESNIPTLYSSINLMLSAFLLFCIGMMHRRTGTPWKAWIGLALIMSFLSVDETASIHEKLIEPTQAFLGVREELYYVWIMPYLSAAAILFLSYFRFFMKLPVRTRTLFILSGGIFILGAAGFETQGNLEQIRQLNTLSYRFGLLLEELFEMLGVICFIYALADYIANRFGQFSITISPQESNAMSDIQVAAKRYGMRPSLDENL